MHSAGVQYELIEQYVPRVYGFTGPLLDFFTTQPEAALSVCMKQEEIVIFLRLLRIPMPESEK